ncbi:dynamin family protein [Pleurocapsa sp. PCC 7319]|uniref:dynamin family protein n=1 Tax=Pleurocapsa sp. PCC 7319 TaxID=118161 RepID=UPI00034D1231|nr:dynamin family protein [Pleurocapsa sp. PCC 7319]
MDFVTQTLLAVISAIARSTLSRLEVRIGEWAGDTILERFLETLEQHSPNTAIAIRQEPVEALDYGQLFQEVKSERQNNTEFNRTVEELASEAKEHPLPSMARVLDKFAAVDELKPQISELKSLINIWSKKMVNIDEIKKYLPDATDEEAQEYLKHLKRLGVLESFFAEYPEDLNGYEDLLARARKAFNYKQPYRIAVAGISGAGKSTMLNAMLGRELLPTKEGSAVTGVALEIFLDVSENDKERAVVTYRDRDNIFQLISKNFFQRYGFDESQFKGEIDDKLKEALEALKSLDYPGNDHEAQQEETRQEFKDLTQMFIDLGEQYFRNAQNTLKTNFSLSNDNDRNELMELIDENSNLNKDIKQRRIGLVKSVTYHLESNKNSNDSQTLQLPGNVCLVDLPGLGGTLLHDIIISERIKDADAVIFITSPSRIRGHGAEDLFKKVRKYISPEGMERSGERIFLVLNAFDKIPTDEVPPEVRGELEKLIELLPAYANSSELSKRGGNNPYFMTSALGAYCAQKKLKGESIAPYRDFYKSLNDKFGGDEEVLKASRVPKLVEELTKFARDKRIEGQIRDGKQALNSIINPLHSWYDSEYRRVIDNQGQYASQKNIEIQIQDKRKVLEKKLLDFRKEILKKFEEISIELQNKANKICDEADDKLREKMPHIWKKHFKTGNDILEIEKFGKPLIEPVLSDAQVELWENLNQRIPKLAIYLSSLYGEAFQKFEVVQKIVNHCFGFKEIVEIEAKIQRFIDDMNRTMAQIAERIAMITMTNRENHFSALQNNKPEKEQLFNIFKSEDMRNENLSPDKFDNFITEARKLYENFVSEYCVSSLLNLYRYEMIVVERKLFKYIDDVFTEMDNQIPNLINNDSDSPVPVWLSEILISDPNWEYEVSLKNKISILSSIKE